MSALPDETLPLPKAEAPSREGSVTGGADGEAGEGVDPGTGAAAQGHPHTAARAGATAGKQTDASVPGRAEVADAAAEAAGDAAPAEAPTRKRPRPGERRVQILQTLAQMLEQPGAERITTAALAARLQVSEAALYRHFASKAQMFEGLIEFIESSVFSLVNQLVEREPDPALQVRRIVTVLLQFGEKNPGMARVMVGDALVFEHERLTARMNQFFDRVESQLRQSLRAAAERAGSATPTVESQALASALVAFATGRLQRFARSGFRRLPTEHLEPILARLAA
jgi:TetR/AcrR family transcriptional regulator